MRTLFGILAVCGLASAGNLYTYEGTSHLHLGQFTPPADLPPLIPAGNFTNQTIFNDDVYAPNDQPLVKIRVDHGVDVGYSGQYNS